MTLHKTSKGDAFSLRSLRISASSALKLPLNAENAEIRRGPQRKTVARSTFLCKTNPDEAMTRPKYIS